VFLRKNFANLHENFYLALVLMYWIPTVKDVWQRQVVIFLGGFSLWVWPSDKDVYLIRLDSKLHTGKTKSLNFQIW